MSKRLAILMPVKSVALAAVLSQFAVTVMVPIAVACQVAGPRSAGCCCTLADKLAAPCCSASVADEPQEPVKPACPRCKAKIAEPVPESQPRESVERAPCKCHKSKMPAAEPAVSIECPPAPQVFDWIDAGGVLIESVRLGRLSHLPATPPPRS